MYSGDMEEVIVKILCALFALGLIIAAELALVIFVLLRLGS